MTPRYKVAKLKNCITPIWFVYDLANKFGPTQRQSFEWVNRKSFEIRADAVAYAKELNAQQ